MADQGRWFKLWCSAVHDPGLANLSLADFGRWCKLGAFVKEHGTGGSLTISSPAKAFCTAMEVDDFTALLAVFDRFPHVIVTVSGVTNATVTYENWHKYQGDNSTHRVSRFRQRVTAKRRGEEKLILPLPNPRKESESKAGGKKQEGSAEGRETASANGQPPTTTFKLNATLLSALDRSPRLGAVTRLRATAYWQAEVRANPGVDFPAELLKAEAYLVAHPERHYKNLAGFLHNWLGRANRETD